MSRYILDTNVLVSCLRQSNSFHNVNKTLDPFNQQQQPVVSVVTLAELNSFAYQHRWGLGRLSAMQNLFNMFVIADIYWSDIPLQTAYQEIDAFSQGLHLTKRLKRSAVNMGKNDLWIAACAQVADAELITFDKDFLHLDGEFFKVHYFPI